MQVDIDDSLSVSHWESGSIALHDAGGIGGYSNVLVMPLRTDT